MEATGNGGGPTKGGTLQDKNQLIRCLALRVMSSIRVHVIVQLVVLAIRKVASVSPCCGAIGPRQAGQALQRCGDSTV